jgi:hypothetical protein
MKYEIEKWMILVQIETNINMKIYSPKIKYKKNSSHSQIAMLKYSYFALYTPIT